MVDRFSRNLKLDFIKSIAILLMFFAHALPHIGMTEVTTVERTLSSLAAPIFLFLVGYNINPTNKSNYKRGLIIIIIAMIIDVLIWNIIPFYSFDVLYIIGIFIMLSNFLNYFKSRTLLIISILTVTISVIYNLNSFYSYTIIEPELSNISDFSIKQLFRNLFLDGWFPVFPWIIFPIFGFIVRSRKIKFDSKIYFLVSILFFSFFLIYCNYEAFFLREFAVEIFYPVKIPYLIGSVSFIYILFKMIDYLNLKPLNFISILGKSSLFFYFFHLLIYHLTFDAVIKLFHSNFYLTFCFFLLIFLITAQLIEYLKLKFNYRNNYLLINILFGKG